MRKLTRLDRLCFLLYVSFIIGACGGLIWLLFCTSYTKALMPEIAIKIIFIPIITIGGYYFFNRAFKAYNHYKKGGNLDDF